jgi:hypothetical protein
MNESSTQTGIKHYQQVDECVDLQIIKNNRVNIAIYQREIPIELAAHLKGLLQQKFNSFKKAINLKDFEQLFDQHFEKYSQENKIGHNLLKKDIKNLLNHFSQISNNDKLTVFFGSIDTDMCRRFHVDMYELRMLCTYQGQGTMWLNHNNINYEALNNFESKEEIAIKAEDVKQFNTAAVGIVKGALYPNSKIGGLVHRSPAIEYLNEKRIVLRVDSNSLIDNF